MSYTYSFGEISAPRTELEALREQLEELRLENEQLKGTVASLQSQLTRQRDEKWSICGCYYADTAGEQRLAQQTGEAKPQETYIPPSK